MDTVNLLEGLNAQQREAVTAPEGPVLVLAGPGSGKTRVLTRRAAWMQVELAVSPWRMMAVTFTNKAAREMRQRLAAMLGENAARAMALGTFHALCARILRREAEVAGLSPDYVIFDSDDQLSLMKQVVRELGLDDKRYRPRSLLNSVSRAKNELIPPTEYPTTTYHDLVAARAYARYQELLRKSNGLDFDDLLMETAKLFQADDLVREKYQHRYRHILVDEFQDTNMAQYVILNLLAREHHSLYVVADEDQSIYSWRGADARNIRRLRQDFPELRTYLLEENYRSTQVILDAAQAVIARNRGRTPKRLFTRRQGGVAIRLREAYDEVDEARFVAEEIQRLLRSYRPGDVAVMYRTNAQSRALEESLVHRNIPYRLIGATRFYARKEIKDLLAYLRLVQNPDDDVSLLRAINVPPRGIGARTIARVSEAAAEQGLSRYRAVLWLLEQRAVKGRTYNALLAFVSLVQQWLQVYQETGLDALLESILADTNYRAYLRTHTQERAPRSDGLSAADARWENVMALQAVVSEAADLPLGDFLTEVALVADVDELSEEQDAVTLLTLHSAKGLEYPVVFITGLEEGRLPHSRSLDTEQEIAEERRLLYVGMTRAKERLYLTYAFRRSWGWGGGEPSEPSRFLDDLPAEVLSRPQPQRTRATSTWSQPAWRPSRPQQRVTQYHVGDRVQHAHYGEGTVMECELSGHEEVVTVLFEHVGAKRLLAGRAPLTVLPKH